MFLLNLYLSCIGEPRIQCHPLYLFISALTFHRTTLIQVPRYLGLPPEVFCRRIIVFITDHCNPDLPSLLYDPTGKDSLSIKRDFLFMKGSWTMLSLTSFRLVKVPDWNGWRLTPLLINRMWYLERTSRLIKTCLTYVPLLLKQDVPGVTKTNLLFLRSSRYPPGFKVLVDNPRLMSKKKSVGRQGNYLITT